MTEILDLSSFSWLNQPDELTFFPGGVEFVTKPDTDFWQRTHYGFRRNTGHALLTSLPDSFTLTFGAEFFYENLFDQCGLFLYLDEENWAKASIENIEGAPDELGSVVTVRGYSDWGTSPVDPSVNRMYYRLHRKGSDFRIDCSFDGDSYRQMRVFHMPGTLSAAKVGVYACSPQQSAFKARFGEFVLEDLQWEDE